MLIEDVLKTRLRVVFCGTALGRTSHRRKAYYAHGGNKFWSTLYDVGLTDRQLQPEEYKDVLRYRIGLTDLCKSEFGNDDELSRNAFDSTAVRAKIEEYQPSILAFTSQTAGRAFCGMYAKFGWQESSINDTLTYCPPHPSGRDERGKQRKYIGRLLPKRPARSRHTFRGEVRFWHLADIPTASLNVRFRG